MKRRHHNNDGRRQIRSGGTSRKLRAIAKRLRIPYISSASESTAPPPEREAKP